MLCTQIVLNVKTKNNFCTQHVLSLYSSCTEVGNQWAMCRHILGYLIQEWVFLKKIYLYLLTFRYALVNLVVRPYRIWRRCQRRALRPCQRLELSQSFYQQQPTFWGTVIYFLGFLFKCPWRWVCKHFGWLFGNLNNLTRLTWLIHT